MKLEDILELDMELLRFQSMRKNPKIKKVIKDFGVEGYGIYFMTLEILKEQENYNYPLNKLESLAREIGTSEFKLRHIVISYKLFEFKTVGEQEVFLSQTLIDFLEKDNK